VLGVRRPGNAPSEFEFDHFDHSAVDLWIDNDGDLEALEASVAITLALLPLLQRQIEWSAWDA